jgi:hypothetical protein
VNRIWLILSTAGHLSTSPAPSLSFAVSWYGGGQYGAMSQSLPMSINLSASAASTWGTAWGTLVWGGPVNSVQPYVLLMTDSSANTLALNMQFGFLEVSTYGWVIVGYYVEVVAEQPVQGPFNVL